MASGDLAICQELEVSMFTALINFVFPIEASSFWVEQDKKLSFKPNRHILVTGLYPGALAKIFQVMS